MKHHLKVKWQSTICNTDDVLDSGSSNCGAIASSVMDSPSKEQNTIRSVSWTHRRGRNSTVSWTPIGLNAEVYKMQFKRARYIYVPCSICLILTEENSPTSRRQGHTLWRQILVPSALLATAQQELHLLNMTISSCAFAGRPSIHHALHAVCW